MYTNSCRDRVDSLLKRLRTIALALAAVACFIHALFNL